jgi:DNA (cytosine-5)-methyltransferase 1
MGNLTDISRWRIKFATRVLTHCELFGGIGGFSLAARRIGGITTTQYVDLNPDAQTVYRSHFPNVPIWGDIRTYHAQRGEFDLITCGFPCTGTSAAGKRTGLQHPQSALWREGIRILIEGRPRFFVIEQPYGVLRRGLRAILGGLRMAG